MTTSVVTGATGGIGAAVVRALAGRGDDVLALGRDRAKLESLAGEVSGVTPVVVDLASELAVPGELAGLEQVDALVHCAGIADVASVADTTSQQWREHFQVNLIAAAELTAALLPALRSARGRVVFVNMAAAMRAVPRWSAYVGTKAALTELADSLRQEEDAHGIRVTSIYPTGTATDLLERVRAAFGRPYDPAQCVQPTTLASYVVMALEAPADAHLTDLSVQPAPSGARD